MNKKTYVKSLFFIFAIVFLSSTSYPQSGGAYTSLDGTFGQPTQHISELTDVLYSATKRFTVAPDVPGVFDGDINGGNWAIPQNTSATLTIQFTTKGEVSTVNGITYPEGY